MIVRTIPKKETTKRVAAYARVSTLTEVQEESYETQVKYYTDFISRSKSWKMVKVYADKGITGTSAVKRPGFMEMIHDALDGKIDIILCKSISRFSRNYEEAQKYTHLLKSLGVEIRFEKEGISTADPQTDMLLGTMMAVSQQESKSISENICWSYKRLAELGIRHVGSRHLLGYDEIQGTLTPNADSWIIKEAFQSYADGKSVPAIVRELNKKGAKALRTGKGLASSNVYDILRNEVYVGDRLMQKTPARNYITKKPDPSIPRETRYIKEHHTPIVSRILWETVQARLKRDAEARENGLRPRIDSHPFYGRIICGCCGSLYRRITNQNKGDGTFYVWKCVNRLKGKCKGRIIREAEIEELFYTGQTKVLITENGLEVMNNTSTESI